MQSLKETVLNIKAQVEDSLGFSDEGPVKGYGVYWVEQDDNDSWSKHDKFFKKREERDQFILELELTPTFRWLTQLVDPLED
jgi:hypothetical protein